MARDNVLEANIYTGKRALEGEMPGTLVFHVGEGDSEITITVTQTADGALIKATDKNSETTAVVYNGKDGYTPVKGVDYKDGKDGDDGFSPVVSVAAIAGGHRITVTDKSGEKQFDVMNGEDGKNYVLTPADKNEIAEIAAGMVDVPDQEDTDLSEYAKRSELPTKVSQLQNDSRYATEQFVKEGYQPKGNYLTEHQSLAGYAKTEDIPKKPEDIGAQPAGNYALKTEIPSVPVQSVNGKTGAVRLSASDVGALPDTYTPPDQTAAQVGADPAGTAASAVSGHNTNTDAHNDIRLEIKAINDRLTAFFDSDDQTLDELSEIVAYITSNKALIEAVTTSKVSVIDIVDNLTTNVVNKPLSAAQGVVLKGLIDAVSSSLAGYQPKGDYALKSQLPTKVSQLTNDKGYLTEHQDISGKLDASALPDAIDDALAQAKASGEFDGKDGNDGISATHSWNGTTLTVSSASGTSSADLKGEKGDDGVSPTAVVSKVGKVTTLSVTDKNGTTTATINDGADGISEDTLPGYWLTHLTTKIPSINTAMETAGHNKSAFFFYTDGHRISSSGMTPAILRYLYKYTSINKTNNGGDFSEPFFYPDYSSAEKLELVREAMADVRGLPNHHSVIGNHDEDHDGLNTDEKLYGFYLAWEESNDIVWGGYHYYYIDNKSESTRYLYLDIGKNFGKTGAIMISNDQMQFVIDSLASVPEGWHVVPIAHIWFDYSEAVNAIPDYVQNVLAVFDAYNGRAAGSVTHNGNAFAYNFAEAVGNVEFCMGGHVHADKVLYSNGGIPIIITDTDSTTRKGSYATLGTITEGCIDAVVVDYNTRKVKLIRIGRGSDRTIDIPTYGKAEIVNILNVYDVQYNARYSPTGQNFKADNGTISFLIPWADVWGKTIYFKGFSNITSKTGQATVFRCIKGTTAGAIVGATDYIIFNSEHLKHNNGVYSIAINATTTSASADSYESLQVQFVLNSTGTTVSAADLANCMMTIDQPIE